MEVFQGVVNGWFGVSRQREDVRRWPPFAAPFGLVDYAVRKSQVPIQLPRLDATFGQPKVSELFEDFSKPIRGYAKCASSLPVDFVWLPIIRQATGAFGPLGGRRMRSIRMGVI